jgi:hypothetical protein
MGGKGGRSNAVMLLNRTGEGGQCGKVFSGYSGSYSRYWAKQNDITDNIFDTEISNEHKIFFNFQRSIVTQATSNFALVLKFLP